MREKGAARENEDFHCPAAFSEDGIGIRTIERVQQRFVEEGFDDALNPRPRPRGSYKLKEDAESQIVEIAKSDPPPKDESGGP